MKIAYIHPIFKRFCFCNDHYHEEFKPLGDALGKDCMIAGFPQGFDNAFPKMYINDGSENTDWLSWNAEVMAPINGRVIEVYENPVINKPGNMQQARASVIAIKAPNKLVICLAHIQNPQIKVGDVVCEGQTIAYVGNNGCCKIPHIHIGVCKGDVPYSIVIHPEKVEKVRNMVGESFWYTGIYDEGYPKQPNEGVRTV